jgi:hypothetical protein
MNDRERRGENGPEPEDRESQGPNLALIYSLIGLALLLAIAIAMMIVFPFYQRR